MSISPWVCGASLAGAATHSLRSDRCQYLLPASHGLAVSAFRLTLPHIYGRATSVLAVYSGPEQNSAVVSPPSSTGMMKSLSFWRRHQQLHSLWERMWAHAWAAAGRAELPLRQLRPPEPGRGRQGDGMSPPACRGWPSLLDPLDAEGRFVARALCITPCHHCRAWLEHLIRLLLGFTALDASVFLPTG